MAVSNEEKNRQMVQLMDYLIGMQGPEDENGEHWVAIPKKDIAESRNIAYSDVVRMVTNLVNARVLPADRPQANAHFTYDISKLLPYHIVVSRTNSSKRRRWIMERAARDYQHGEYDHERPIKYEEDYRLMVETEHGNHERSVGTHMNAIVSHLQALEQERDQWKHKAQEEEAQVARLYERLDRNESQRQELKAKHRELQQHNETLLDVSDLDQDMLTRVYYKIIDDIDRFLAEPSHVRKQNIYHLRKRMIEHTSSFLDALNTVTTEEREVRDYVGSS